MQHSRCAAAGRTRCNSRQETCSAGTSAPLTALAYRLRPPPACGVQVWDLNTLSRVKTLTGHTDAVRALACADGRLFSGSYDGTVRVWDENSLQCLEILKGHTGPVRTLVYAGGCMFSGSYDKTVRVWDVHTLECKAVLTGHTGAVRALVASQTHGYVFSGSDDTTIKVWDVRTLKCVKTLEGHEDNVRVLAVGDTHMFSGSWDKTIRVWDLRTLECIKVLEGHTEAVLALAGAWLSGVAEVPGVGSAVQCSAVQCCVGGRWFTWPHHPAAPAVSQQASGFNSHEWQRLVGIAQTPSKRRDCGLGDSDGSDRCVLLLASARSG